MMWDVGTVGLFSSKPHSWFELNQQCEYTLLLKCCENTVLKFIGNIMVILMYYSLK